MNTNTMRKAFLKWQASENQREAAREELNQQYLALLQEAEAAHLDTGSGLLQAAPVMLNQPLDARTHQAQHRLNNAFALLGKGFFRRAPTSLQLDIRHYAAHIDDICRHYHRLSARLRLARQVIQVLQQNPELTDTPIFPIGAP